MVVVLSPYPPHLLPRDIWHIGQQRHLGTSGCSSVPVHGEAGLSWGWRRGRKERRREVDVGAFWQDVSKPASVEMEPIKDMEQLDEILRRCQEDESSSIIIDWIAAWCRKCIYLKPKLEKLAADYHPKIKFYYVDVNNVSQALVKRGNISKMPTIQLWKDGEMQAEVIGGHKAWLVVEEVKEMIKKYS